MNIAKIVFGFGMIVSIILCSGLAMLFNSATHYEGFAPVQFASAGETTPTWSAISSITVINGSMKSVVHLGDSNVSAGINK